MGVAVRWPQIMKTSSDKRDMSKWCEFDDDHGHQTKDCITLRMDVNDMLKKGHFREFLSERSRNRVDKRGDDKTSPKSAPASLPRHDRPNNVITGGSELIGVSYLAAKKNMRTARITKQAAKS